MTMGIIRVRTRRTVLVDFVGDVLVVVAVLNRQAGLLISGNPVHGDTQLIYLCRHSCASLNVVEAAPVSNHKP